MDATEHEWHRSNKMHVNHGDLRHIVLVSFSAVLLSVLVAFFSTTSHLSVTDVSVYIPDLIAKLTVSILAVTSMVSVSIVLRCRRHNTIVNIESKGKINEKFKIICLWIFGLSVIIVQIMYTIIDIDCSYTASFSVLFLTMLMQTLTPCLLIAESIFVTRYHGYTFQMCTRIKVCLSMLLISNLSLWYRSFVKNIAGTFFKPDVIGNENSTAGDQVAKCFWTHPLQNTITYLLPYITPMGLQFLLLSTRFIIQMWPKDNSSSRTREVSRTAFIAATVPQFRVRATIAASLMLVFILRFPQSLILVLLKFDTSYSDDSTETFLHYWSVCSTVVLLCLLIFYIHILEKYRAEYSIYSVGQKDIITILGVMGLASVEVVDMVLSFYYNGDMFWHYGVHNILNLMFAYMQTIVTLLCRRLRTIRRHSLIIILILGILSFNNFAAWAQGTFINYCGVCNFAQMTTNILTRKQWLTIRSIFHAVAMFFRFDCFSMWLGILQSVCASYMRNDI